MQYILVITYKNYDRQWRTEAIDPEGAKFPSRPGDLFQRVLKGTKCARSARKFGPFTLTWPKFQAKFVTISLKSGTKMQI